jgi:hypothetical protein
MEAKMKKQYTRFLREKRDIENAKRAHALFSQLIREAGEIEEKKALEKLDRDLKKVTIVLVLLMGFAFVIWVATEFILYSLGY